MAAEIETIKCDFVNVFIISDGGCSILVDTGMEKNRYSLLKKAREKNVRLLVLTHCHPDHAENAAYLSKELNIPVAMGEGDVKLIKNQDAEKMVARDLIGKEILHSGGTIPEFIPSVLLKEGDSLLPYGVNARIVELPGHTAGSIGIDVEGKYLIVGDALMNMMHPSLPHIYGDYDKMIDSARKIEMLGERTIYFGHGRCVNNRKWA